MRGRRGVALGGLLGGFLSAACGPSPTRPTPPPLPDAPTISCPASIPASSADGLPVVVAYDAPTTAGGLPPVTAVCTAPSGSSFPVDTTEVTCTARDVLERSSSCSFTVTIVRSPRLSATRFVAFGDSITEGKLAFGPMLLITSPSFSYPFRLQLRLTERYRMQTFDVLDEGLGGERIEAGVRRLPGVLNTDNPGVLLLLEGVNNLNADGASAIPTVVDGLRSMIRTTRGRGIPVFIATLLPQRVGGSRAKAATLIQPANAKIRDMAVGEGAVLVDLYEAFVGQEATLLGSDGLHPTVAGYDQIAATFFESIRAQLEVAQGFWDVRPTRLTTKSRLRN